MKFDLRFLAGFESDSLQFSDDFFRENIVEQLLVGHLAGVFNF